MAPEKPRLPLEGGGGCIMYQWHMAGKRTAPI